VADEGKDDIFRTLSRILFSDFLKWLEGVRYSLPGTLTFAFLSTGLVSWSLLRFYEEDGLPRFVTNFTADSPAPYFFTSALVLFLFFFLIYFQNLKYPSISKKDWNLLCFSRRV